MVSAESGKMTYGNYTLLRENFNLHTSISKSERGFPGAKKNEKSVHISLPFAIMAAASILSAERQTLGMPGRRRLLSLHMRGFLWKHRKHHATPLLLHLKKPAARTLPAYGTLPKAMPGICWLRRKWMPDI